MAPGLPGRQARFEATVLRDGLLDVPVVICDHRVDVQCGTPDGGVELDADLRVGCGGRDAGGDLPPVGPVPEVGEVGDAALVRAATDEPDDERAPTSGFLQLITHPCAPAHSVAWADGLPGHVLVEPAAGARGVRGGVVGAGEGNVAGC